MTTTLKKLVCICGGGFDVADAYGNSSTRFCRSCHHASLVLEHSQFEMTIHLSDFHIKRGEGCEQRPLDDLGMARRLVACLENGSEPSPASRVDFGIDKPAHLRALKHAVQSGISAYDLDRVMGDGPAITALTQGIPDQPESNINFRTAYDGLMFLFEAEEEEL